MRQMQIGDSGQTFNAQFRYLDMQTEMQNYEVPLSCWKTKSNFNH
jgi:hypothetical protein